MYIDSHCHLNDTMLENDIESIILECKAKSVNTMIVVGFDYESSLKAIEIAKRFPNTCRAAVGIHPSEVSKINIDSECKKIEGIINAPEVIAVGEIGLDYHYGVEDKEEQIELLKKQIVLSNKYSKPIIFHVRDAFGDFMNIINNITINKKGVIHCFSGSKEIALELTNKGFYLGVGGVLTFKNSKEIKNVILNMDKTKLLFETDSPYLAPEPHRGQVNKPYNVIYVYEKAQEILNIPSSELQSMIENNFKKAFNYGKD